MRCSLANTAPRAHNRDCASSKVPLVSRRREMRPRLVSTQCWCRRRSCVLSSTQFSVRQPPHAPRRLAVSSPGIARLCGSVGVARRPSSQDHAVPDLVMTEPPAAAGPSTPAVPRCLFESGRPAGLVLVSTTYDALITERVATKSVALWSPGIQDFSVCRKGRCQMTRAARYCNASKPGGPVEHCHGDHRWPK